MDFAQMNALIAVKCGGMAALLCLGKRMDFSY